MASGAGSSSPAFFCGREQDLLVCAHHLFERIDRLLAADEQRHDHVRKDHDVAQRQRPDRSLLPPLSLPCLWFAHVSRSLSPMFRATYCTRLIWPREPRRARNTQVVAATRQPTQSRYWLRARSGRMRVRLAAARIGFSYRIADRRFSHGKMVATTAPDQEPEQWTVNPERMQASARSRATPRQALSARALFAGTVGVDAQRTRSAFDDLRR